jgi:hypothetical protein
MKEVQDEEKRDGTASRSTTFGAIVLEVRYARRPASFTLGPVTGMPLVEIPMITCTTA